MFINHNNTIILDVIGKHLKLNVEEASYINLQKIMIHLESKGANIILLWNFLVMTVYHRITTTGQGHLIAGELVTAGLLLPIGGWLADTHFGRFNIVYSGMWTMWMGAVLATFSLFLSKINDEFAEHGDVWVSRLATTIMGAGFGAFLSNIVQFGIDQLSEASSTEITKFITWFTTTMILSGIATHFSTDCTPDYVGVLVVTTCLSVALCSNFLSNQHLVKEHPRQNPLPMIWSVVKYSAKNKHLRKRFSSLQEPHGGILTCLNISKTIYAGPFTNEQVEDVKAFFRVLAVIATCILACGGIPIIQYAQDQILHHMYKLPTKSLAGCYQRLSMSYVTYIFALLTMLVYQFIARPVFYNFLQNLSITTKFLIAVILFLLRIVSLLSIESASYHISHNANETVVHCVLQDATNYIYNINFYWIIIPEAFSGLSSFILILAGIEFICAQAPFSMKGLTFGISYGLYGLASLLQIAISYPFFFRETVWVRAPLTCGIWYFLMQGVIVLIGLALVIFMIKTYRTRTRSSAIQTSEECHQVILSD